MVAVNLALSLSNREDCRTALVDLDLRCPRIAEIIGTGIGPSMESFLRGRSGLEQTFRRPRPNLAVASNGQPVRLPAELLQGPETARVLREMKQALSPDVIHYDLPPMLSSDDALAFLPNVDGVILVVEARRTRWSRSTPANTSFPCNSNVLGVVREQMPSRR